MNSFECVKVNYAAEMCCGYSTRRCSLLPNKERGDIISIMCPI